MPGTAGVSRTAVSGDLDLDGHYSSGHNGRENDREQQHVAYRGEEIAFRSGYRSTIDSNSDVISRVYQSQDMDSTRSRAF